MQWLRELSNDLALVLEKIACDAPECRHEYNFEYLSSERQWPLGWIIVERNDLETAPTPVIHRRHLILCPEHGAVALDALLQLGIQMRPDHIERAA